MREALSLPKGFIIVIMNRFMTFIIETEPIEVGARTAELVQTHLVLGHADASRRSVGVAPSAAVNGRCGIRLAPGDRRARRRRGRPL
jgi:hypothetical protein